LLDIKDLEKTIAVEVREAYRQIKTDIKRVHATRLARKLAEEKLSAEEKKFEVGLSTSFNVLEFQEDLAEQQSNEIKAVIDYKKSKNRLRQVKAQTLKDNNIEVSESDKT
jgi:outer membrane protein TolC